MKLENLKPYTDQTKHPAVCDSCFGIYDRPWHSVDAQQTFVKYMNK